MAHIEQSKTTTTERILFYTERVHKLGKRTKAPRQWTGWQGRGGGITITSSATHAIGKVIALTLSITPGHVDFTVEVGARWKFWTVLWQYSAQWVGLSPSLKQFGG